MATALEQWRRHRVDYRIPGLLSALLVVFIFSLLPQLWVRWARIHPPAPATETAIAPLFAKDEGLQILDVEVLGAPRTKPASMPVRVVPERTPISSREETLSAGQEKTSPGMEEFAWDPTHGYRLGKELLAPPDSVGSDRFFEDQHRRLEFLLSLDGAASLAVTDTSQSARARRSFVVLQQQIFRRNAPDWAYEKAVERTRRALAQMAMDNPLRGPQ